MIFTAFRLCRLFHLHFLFFEKIKTIKQKLLQLFFLSKLCNFSSSLPFGFRDVSFRLSWLSVSASSFLFQFLLTTSLKQRTKQNNKNKKTSNTFPYSSHSPVFFFSFCVLHYTPKEKATCLFFQFCYLLF